MTNFSRRTFLKGAAGLSAAAATHLLPHISTLRAQTVAPKRLFVFFTPLGTIEDQWFPSTTGSNFQLSPTLQPLQAHRDRLLILRGLRQQNEIHDSANHQEIGGILTGMRVNGNEANSSHAHISIDQFLAKDPAINGGTPFNSVCLAAWQGRYQRFLPEVDHMYMSALGPNQAVVPWGLPQEAFDTIFGGFTTPDPDAPTTPDPRRVARRSVLDSIVSELETVNRRLGTNVEERAKIDQHLTSLRALEQRLQSPSPMVSGCMPPNRPATYEIDDDDTLDVRIRLQLDIAIASLACDRTRVVAFTAEGGRSGATHPWLGINERFHEITHSPYDQEHAAISRWYAGEFAYLLDQLDSIPDGDGTMLDSTCVVWVTEQGSRTASSEHSRDNMPYLIAGGGGHFRTGRVVDVSGYQSNSFLISVMNAMGVAGDTFGSVAAPPLPDLT